MGQLTISKETFLSSTAAASILYEILLQTLQKKSTYNLMCSLDINL